MKIYIALIIFLILLAGTAALQLLYVKRAKLRFLTASLFSGLLGLISSAALATYYNIALENAKERMLDAFFNMAEFQEKLQSFEHYSIICIFFACIFIMSLVVSLILPLLIKLIRKHLEPMEQQEKEQEKQQ